MKYLRNIYECPIAILGLGYVGLPLLFEFSKRNGSELQNQIVNRKIIGFDINIQRIRDLKNNFDNTGEINSSEFCNLKNTIFTSDLSLLTQANVFIITVPTPINENNNPDFSPLINASKTIGKIIKKQKISKDFISPIIIYESTVYPGAMEEVCVPVLEEYSDLKYNKDFFLGYSPERINPGDNTKKLTDIMKLTSGSNPETANFVNNLYDSIIDACTFKTSSIRVAEAAKVIENIQRDLNIALVNELSIIFRKFGLDTHDVLEAASTKWNFLKFKPGLVGGHCIGVDPYYLTYKSIKTGYQPDLVLAGRKLNNEYSSWIVQELILELVKKGKIIKNETFLLLGFSFKENCSDTRNTKVIDVIKHLNKFGIKVHVVDPFVDTEDVLTNYGVEIYSEIPIENKYSVVIPLVAHKNFVDMSTKDWENLLKDEGIIFDFKNIAPRISSTLRI